MLVYLSLISIVVTVFLGTGFILLALKRKGCGVTYALWGSSFYLLAGWDIIYILGEKGVIGKDIQFYLANFSWLLFLVLLYFGTVYIFTRKILVALTYILLIPALFAPLYIILLPSQPALVAFAVGFIIFIPLQLVIGMLSWFLGISALHHPPRLFSYWAIGGAFFLSVIETALISVAPLIGKNLQEASFETGSVGYLGIISEVLFVLAFASLLFQAIRQNKECF